MAKEYVEQLAALIRRVTFKKFKSVTLECNHFFSGAAVYADGKICISLTPAGFAIKLPERSRNMLMKKNGAIPLRYFPNGPVKKEYVVLPTAMVKDKKALRRRVNASIEYVLSSER